MFKIGDTVYSIKLTITGDANLFESKIIKHTIDRIVIDKGDKVSYYEKVYETIPGKMMISINYKKIPDDIYRTEDEAQGVICKQLDELIAKQVKYLDDLNKY